jgi:hypothetical protein
MNLSNKTSKTQKGRPINTMLKMTSMSIGCAGMLLAPLVLTVSGCIHSNKIQNESTHAVLALPDNKIEESIFIKPYKTGKERRVDNPVDVWMNAHSGLAGKDIRENPTQTQTQAERYDILSTDSKNGDFSVVFTVDNPENQSAFGLTCGNYIERWELGSDFSLHLWIKLDAKGGTGPFECVLYDIAGKKATIELKNLSVDNKWQQLNLALNDFNAEQGLDYKSLRTVQLEAKLPKTSRLWLDDVYFFKGPEHLGISDKTITQYMDETDATRPKRSEELLRAPCAYWMSSSPGTEVPPVFWDGADLEKANQTMYKMLVELMDADNLKQTTYNLHNPLHGAFLSTYYLAYSSKGRLKPCRLSREVEKLLLEAMWMNDLLVNDISLTRQSTWYVIGSENHDYVNKHKALLNSQIFMHEPEYAERIYPDPGNKLGFQSNDMFLHWIHTTQYEVQGDGHYKDGKEYTARDHYHAWVKFWKEYLAERARHGFFIEHNSNGYSLAAVNNMHSIYTWVEDDDLRREAKMFLDLMWAQWLQDQMLLIQGGAVTRGMPGLGVMGKMAWFYLGGDGMVNKEAINQLAMSDYKWPRFLWEMALDRKGRGEYAYVSRKPNEEIDFYPRPKGSYETMFIRPDSRIVRYSWVTPHYVFGMRMDYPKALYTHLSMSEQGITFPTSADATIFIKPGPYYRAVQDRNVAIMKQNNYVMVQHPPHFPSFTSGFGGRKPVTHAVPVEVEFGKGVDLIEEQDGWVFAREGNAYAAFRVVSPTPMELAEIQKTKKGDTEIYAYKLVGRDEQGFALLGAAKDNYTLEGESHKVLKSKGDQSALIVEMSDNTKHASFEVFKKDVLDNPLRLKIHNPLYGYYLTYKGCGKDAKELYLNVEHQEVPKINGEYISYESPTFESPWIHSPFGSGVVTLTAPISGEKTIYDFNKFDKQKVENEMFHYHPVKLSDGGVECG